MIEKGKGGYNVEGLAKFAVNCGGKGLTGPSGSGENPVTSEAEVESWSSM